MEEFFYKKLYVVIIAQYGENCQENFCGFFMFFIWIVLRMNQTENILESIGSGYFSNRKTNRAVVNNTPRTLAHDWQKFSEKSEKRY